MAERIADIERARDALGRESWAEAYEELAALGPADLTPADLEGWADAAWWLAKIDESMAVRQKAYAAYASAGDDKAAALVAGRLCIEHFLRGEPAVGAGWLGRTQRHARELPDCLELGFLAMLESTIARFGGDLEEASALAERAVEIEHRFGDRNLLAMAIQTQGLVQIAAGRVTEGLALLDEAMTSVLAGEVSAYYTGAIYCEVIGACLEVSDIGRASEWSRAAMAWVETIPPLSPFPGVCRVNRAHLARLRGAWSEAQEEASKAAEELAEIDPATAGAAFYESGEIRRRTGDLAGAQSDFARAHELGFEPQPGLALLRLDQAKVGSAGAALDVALSGGAGKGLHGATLLSARVDVALAANEVEIARSAADELNELADGFDAQALHAAAATAEGAVRLAEGNVPAALEILRRASATWQELKLPYETARARRLFGLAVRAAGDEEDARLELRAALAMFERLGAAPDVTLTAELLHGREELPRGLTPREAEVLRLVAAGKTNRDIAVELVISEHTVARHLQNMFAKLDVSSRSAATAFAFEHGLA